MGSAQGLRRARDLAFGVRGNLAGPHEIVCRAWDSAAMTQPEDPAHLWNFRGLMNNAWHRVRVWVA